MQKLTEIIRGPSSIGKTHASKVTGKELTVYGFPLENYIHHLDFLWLYIIPQGLGYLCWRKHNIRLCMQNAGQWNLVHAWRSLIQELSVPIFIGMNDENCVKTSFSCNWRMPALPYNHFGFGKSKYLVQHEEA